jgi:Chalcone isomerase-like
MRAILLILLLGALPAVESHGRQIPDTAQVGNANLALRGADMLVWKWLVDLYVAALYLPPGVSGVDAAVAATPKRLRMEYARDFTKANMVEATDETLGRNVTPAERLALQASLTAWNALYPAPKKGDVVTFDHLPGGDLIMSLNGTELGRIHDEAFARALFAIWIGANPVKNSLRDTLIGK